MKKKILCLLLIMLMIPMGMALKVSPRWMLIERVPVGVRRTLTSVREIEVENTSPVTIEYIATITTAKDTGMTPASERTPYLREYKCNECGKTFVADERYVKECPHCDSNNIEGMRVYQYIEGKEYLFKDIEPIPDTSWVKVYPSEFTLKPNEKIKLNLMINIPENQFGKFYEFVVDILPKMPDIQYITTSQFITTESTTELQTHTFKFKIEGEEEDKYIILYDEEYPMISTSNDLADVLNIRIYIDNQWWELYPIYHLPYKLQANKEYPLIINYKTQDVNKLGTTNVKLTLKYMKQIPQVLTAVSLRIWVHTVEDQEQNEAVISSGKVSLISSSSETDVPIVKTPLTTTAPTSSVPPTDISDDNIFLIVAVILMIVLIIAFAMR